MNATETEIAAAQAYESLLVASLFGEWAGKVSDAAELGSGHTVLDVACGTGVLAREARKRVGPDGNVTGIDAAAGMLAVAAGLDPEIEWEQGQAEELPFPDDSFDRVLSQFGLMFFNDRVRALREMLRVVRPGGRFVVAVWDAIENLPAYAASAALLEELAGKAASDCVRAPFVLGDALAVQHLFEQAGCEDLKATTVKGSARFPSLRSMMEADLRGWLPLLGVELGEPMIAEILAKAESRLGRYVEPSGELVFSSSAHIFTATK